MTHDVIVIGAGVSGLSTAHNLVARGYDVQVLERQVNIGGNAISERFDGFLMEHGPSTLNASVQGIDDRLRDLGLFESANALGPEVKNRFLVDNDSISSISVSPLGFFTSGYLSKRARMAMATEILRPRKKTETEETIHQFATRRFGQEFADRVIDPMAAGLFMGDSKNLSVEGAFPKLLELEQRYGSITRGVLNAKRGSEPGRRLLSWTNGIAEIPNRLSLALEGRIHTGSAVTGISPTPNGFEVRVAGATSVKTRVIVLAVQPHVVASLLENIEPETASAAREISAPAIGVVYFGFHRDQVSHPLDGLGFLSTKSENRIISGAQFCSTMFEGRAPEGYVSIACYTGGARNPELENLPNAELVNAVKTELYGLLGIKGEPAVTRTRRWARGLPQYTLGYTYRRRILESVHERLPQLFLTGNYLAGVSIGNCMATAGTTSKKVHDLLKEIDYIRGNSLEATLSD